jgi:hypothetical protein
MRFLLQPPPPGDTTAAVEAAIAARDAGLDGILIEPSATLPAALVTTAAVAAAVDDGLLAASVPLGDRHPIEVAEEVAVVDLAAAGRLVLVVSAAAGCEARFAEALDLLRRCLTPRPFRFSGRHWRVPEGSGAVRVTPAPRQVRLEIWVAGAEPSPAFERGLGHLAEADADDESLVRAWAQEGPLAIGAPRARRERFDGSAALLERLRRGQASFGQDWAVVLGPAADAGRIGREVRPRVQLPSLPPGLEDFWADRA